MQQVREIILGIRRNKNFADFFGRKTKTAKSKKIYIINFSLYNEIISVKCDFLTMRHQGALYTSFKN